MKKNTIKLCLLIVQMVALILLLRGSVILSGSICIAVGIIGSIFRLFGFELMVLVGLMPILFGLQQKCLLTVVLASIVLISTYDFVQFLKIIIQNSENPDFQKEWLSLFQKKELLYRLTNKLRHQKIERKGTKKNRDRHLLNSR